MSEELVCQAIQLGFEITVNTRALGLYLKIQVLVHNFFQQRQKQIPQHLQGHPQMNRDHLQQEYNLAIKKKDNELQLQMKSMIKDSMRISLKELGQIHYNYGFLQEANQQWIKSLDMSSTNEDIFIMSTTIAKCAQQSGQDYLAKKFSQDALAKDNGKNPESTAILRILDGLSCFGKDSSQYQISVLKLIEVVLPTDQSENFEQNQMSEVITPNDLAYYICLAAMISCNRKELRETVLKSSNFVMLTSSINEDAFIIEQFLNGNYTAFNQSLARIQSALHFDPFVGDHTDEGQSLFREIRLRALKQYIVAYKVLTLKAIAQEFNQSVETIESDLVELISTGQLDYRINDIEQTVHKKVVN
jgi:COP9 signalosome complex subunit 1